MPDAQGNFKSISVPADAWERIFGQPTPDNVHDAQALGCTCQWYRRGSIIEFDKACPIYDRHRHPNRDKRPTDK